MKMLLACSLLLASLAPLQDAEAPPSREIGAHARPIRHLGLSSDGETLVTCSDDGSVHAWDLKEDELLWKQEEGLDRAPTGFSVGESLIAYHPGMAAAFLRELATGDQRSGVGGTTARSQSRCLSIDPMDRWIWIGTDEGVVTRVIPDAVNSWSNRNLENGGVTCMAMDPKGKTLVVGGADGTVRFVGAKSANVDDKKVIEGEGRVLRVATDPKVGYVVLGSEAGLLQVWKASNTRLRHTLEGHVADISALAVEPKGKRFASGDEGGHVRIWTLSKGESLLALDLEGVITGLLFLDKGKTLATTTDASNRVTLWDLSEL